MWYFTSVDSIMNQNPAIAQLSVVKRERQRTKIEPTFRRLAGMTVEARLPDQLTKWLGKFGHNWPRCVKEERQAKYECKAFRHQLDTVVVDWRLMIVDL